ncbi:MAG: PAS domain S-box protein [Candidatus Neomarinimicrobiota bacterium]
MNRFLGQIAQNEIRNSLKNSKLALSRLNTLQEDLLISKARSLSQVPYLKAVMNIPQVDHETVFYTAQNLRESSKLDLMLLIDANGILLADMADQTYFDHDLGSFTGIANSLNGEEYKGVYQYRDKLYLVGITTIEIERQLLGLLLVGQAIDDSSLDEIKKFTGSNVLLFWTGELKFQALKTQNSESISAAELSILTTQLNELEKIDNMESPIFPITLTDQISLAMAIPLENSSAYTVIFRPLDENESRITFIRITLFLTGIISIILSIFISFWLSSAISKPILGLRDAAEKFGAGQLETRIKVLSNNELGQLSAAFNKMAEDIQTFRRSLEAERDHTENILDSMIDLVFVVNSKGFIQGLNQASMATLGYTKAELSGKSFQDLFRITKKDSGIDSFNATWNNLIKNRFLRHLEGVFLTKNGVDVPVILSGSVLQNDENNSQGIVLVAKDISGQKQTEKLIQKLSHAVEQSSSVIMITDIDGKLEYVNPKFENVTGWSTREVIGKNPRILKSGKHPQKLYKNLWDTIISGKDWQGEFINRKKNGEFYWASANISPIRNEEQQVTHFIGVQEDVTKRKLAEKLLQDSQKQLKALTSHIQQMQEEERTRISREIHDELGQSLTGIKMELVWLKDEISTKQKPAINKIIKFLETTMNTVQRISTQLRPVILDDLGLVAAIEWEVQEFQTRSGIKCELNFETENISIDDDRATAIFRILQEALTNILRHAEANSVVVALKQEKSTLLLIVSDDGKGILEEQINNRDSLGILGMQERIQLWNGEFQIGKVNNSGTTLTVRLPLETKP